MQRHRLRPRRARWRAALEVTACALAGGLTSSGCDYGCIDVACDDGVELVFEPALREAGQYVFELDADGQASRCELAFDPGARGEAQGGCETLFVRGSNVPVGTGVTEGAPFEIVGFDLPLVERVSVAVHRDGVLLADYDVSPRYRRRHVNDSCGKCQVASETLRLP